MTPTVIYRDDRPSKTYKMSFYEAVFWASHFWADGCIGSVDDAKDYMSEAASSRIVDMIFEELGEPKQTFEADIDLFCDTAGEIFREQVSLAAEAYVKGQIQTAKKLLTEVMPIQDEVEAVFLLSQDSTSLSKDKAFLDAVANIIGRWKSDI